MYWGFMYEAEAPYRQICQNTLAVLLIGYCDDKRYTDLQQKRPQDQFTQRFDVRE